MNFKRMNFLLIMLALVLLVGIGSVSAASDDGADIISDDITDEILSDGEVSPGPDSGDTELTEPVETEKTNTAVNSEDVTVKHGDSINIPVNVTKKDDDTKIVEFNNDTLKVSEGNKSLAFNYNDTAITITDALNVGIHNITILYTGNDVYNSSSKLIKLSIYGDNDLIVPSVVEYNGTIVEIPVNLTDGIDDHTNQLTSENTILTLKYETETLLLTYVLDGNVIKLQDLSGKVPAILTINYTENEKSVIKNVAIKIKTILEITPQTNNITEGQNATFDLSVKDYTGNPVEINSSDLTISSIAKGKYNSTAGLTVYDLKSGVYNITITYKGNDNYSSSKMNIIVNVRGEFAINTNVTSIDVNSTKKGEFKINNISNGVDFKEFTKDDLNITVSYKDGNQTKSINVTSFDLADGVISFVLENGNFTNATLTISYNNGDVESNITLHRIYNARIEVINNENDFLSGNFTYKLIDIDDENEILANKSVTFVSDELFVKKVGTNTSSNPIRVSAQTDSEGILNFKNSNLKPVHYGDVNDRYMRVYGDNFNIGTHNVTLKAGDNLKFDDFKTNVTINKLSIIITPKAFSEYYGTDKKFQIEVRNARTNELVSGLVLKLDIPQTTGKTYYVSTNDDGIGEIGVNKLVGGTYNVGITNNDTDNINSTVNNTTLTIKKIPVKIDTSSKTMYYNSGSTAKITIKNAKTGKAVAGVYVFVRLYTSSTKYNDYLFMTNSKGVVEFSAPLNVGKHKMIVATADTRYEGSSVTRTITVKNAPAKITAAKKTAYYKQGKYFVVKVTNTKNNKPIYNAKLNIRVFVTSTKYYNFNGRTGANGQIKLSMDLKPGTYNVVIIDKDANMVAKQATSKMVIKKAPAKFSAPKVTAKKKANKYFKVKVINKKTKKIIPGVKVKVKVYTGKKSKTYTIKTNSKGIAKLNTKSLKVGKHKVVITSANKYVKASKKTSSIKITK